MVTEALINLVAGFWAFWLSQLPDVGEVPEWVDSIGAGAGQVGAWLGQFDSWLPTGMVAAVFSTIVGVWIVGVVIKLVRIVASFLTAGGGAAG